MFAKCLAASITAIALSLAASLAYSATFYVNQSVPSSGNGASWETAFKTIQEGIRAARDGDEVIVASGTYVETVDFEGKAITVCSKDDTDPGVVASTVIELGTFPEIVRFRSGETRGAVIAGFTIASGQVGISCVWSSPVIRNNVIVANTADFDKGGGISCYYSSPLIENNIIASNIAAAGGAGVACEGAQPVIIGNLIIANVTDAEGGGILCVDCSPTIARNRIIANSAQGNGGGISYWGSQPQILDNLIVSNVANVMGGGIACYLSRSKILGSTIANNSAQGGGAGGIHFLESSGQILNCILWGNGDDIAGCSATFTCIEDNEAEDQGEGNVHDDPNFADPDGPDDLLGTQDDDYRLSPDSPCLDKGSLSGSLILLARKEAAGLFLSWDPGTDLLGQPRISGTAPDMGCCEYPASPPLYVLESSNELQQWSLLHQGSETAFSFDSFPPSEKQFFRVSLAR